MKAVNQNEKRNALLIFVLLLGCYAYFFPRWADWNQNSRMDLVMAIVDKGTVSIDDYFTNTGDYAIYEGHHYSTKAPGSALLGVPFYWVFRQIVNSSVIAPLIGRLSSSSAVQGTLTEGGTGLLPEKVYFAMATFFTTFGAVSIPAALLGVVIYLFAGYYTTSQAIRLWVTLIYGLATSAFPYSGMLMGHQIVASFLFISFFLIFLIGRGKMSVWWLPLIGFLMGYAVITEYPTVLIAGGIGLYAIYRLPKKAWIAALIAGGVLPGIIWMIYNYQIYHSAIGFGYLYAPLYTDKNNVGFFSIVAPTFEALWGISFSAYRGLFFLSPVLLLAIPGFVYFWRERNARPEALVCLWATTSFFLFVGSSIMWDGGYGVGPRYVLPMVPFMAFALTFSARQWMHKKWAKVLMAFLSIWSFLFVWAESIGGQNFPDWSRNPMIEYTLPLLLKGDITRNWGTILGLPGWTSLLPLLLFAGAMAWLIWRSMQNLPLLPMKKKVATA